jgi:hypothetical protein
VFAALQTHLGLAFVSGADAVAAGAVRLDETFRDASLAAKLRDAVAIGAVTDLEIIAEGLSSGNSSEALLGQRLARLAANFDFEGVRELAASLAKGPESRDAR